MSKFILGLKNMKTAISQIGIDFCEERAYKANNIKREIFWHKVGCWFLRH